MKKLLCSLVILFATSLFAETEQIGPWGGLNNTENSYIIGANQSQDLLNVDITDEAKSIKKRKGYGTAFTLSNATSPIHGTYLFFDSDGSDVALAFNDRNVNRSISGSSMSVIWSTATNGATWQCTDSAGFAYCANTSRDGIFKIDASAISLLSGFTSTGTMVTVTPERLVQSGFSTDPNVILFSKANDFTTWTLGGNPTDPIQFTITSPGSGVKCIAYAHGRVYWWKDNSFGFILEGATQADWRVVTIDPGLGSINNTFIYREEILYFQANDGHFYAYDGSQLVKLSKDIQATIDETQGRTTNSWSQSSQTDFSAGATRPAGFISSSVVSGSLMGSSFTVTETSAADFALGTTSNVYVTGNSLIISTNSNNINDPSFELDQWVGTGSGDDTNSFLATDNCGANTARTGSYAGSFTETTGSWSVGPHLIDGVTETLLFSGSSVAYADNSCSWTSRTITGNTVYTRRFLKLQFRSSNGGDTLTSPGFIYNGLDLTYYTKSDLRAGAPTFRLFMIDDVTGGGSDITTGTYTSKSYDTGISTNYVSVSSVGATINDYTPNITLQTSHDSSNWVSLGSGLTSTSTLVGRRYLRYISSFTVSGSSDALSTLDNVTLVARATGTYLSDVHNAPNITSWDTFGSEYAENGGSLAYSVRSATGIFTILSSTPNWTAITPGSIPSISTGVYFQMMSSFSVTAATQNPTINSFTFNWFEGGASDKTYAIYHDNANWWSVTSGTGATTNNKILKFNLLQPGWYIYDIGMAGMYVRSQSLYFGSVSAGKVYKFGDTDSDDGAAIESYWKSKDFFGTSPFLDKDYTRISSIHPQVSNSTVTVTYTINGSSSTSYNVPLTNSNLSFIPKNVNLPQGRTGKTINIKFGNDAIDQPWEVFGAQIDYTPKSWKPE